MRSGVFYMIDSKNESLMSSKPKSDPKEQSQWKWENELGPYHPGRVCLWYRYFVSLGFLVYEPESLYRLVLPPMELLSVNHILPRATASLCAKL